MSNKYWLHESILCLLKSGMCHSNIHWTPTTCRQGFIFISFGGISTDFMKICEDGGGFYSRTSLTPSHP